MSKNIGDLHPKLAPLCLEWMHNCVYAGLDVRIAFTYRSPEEQNALYTQGRTKPGKIVTNLKGGASKHCFEIDGKPASKAFDFEIFDRGTYITDGEDPRYKQAGDIAIKLGMVWGGNFVHPRPDYDHVEMKG